MADEKKKSIKEVLQAQGLASDIAEGGEPEETPELQSTGFYVQGLKKLSDKAQQSPLVPPETKQSLQDAMNSAKELYQQQANRNDWLEVAQTLGRAVAQFGAAQSGMRSGRDMSGLNFGPGINYEGRNQRALAEYRQGVDNAKDLAGADKEKYREEATAQERGFNREEDYFKSGLGAARESEHDKSSNARQNKADKRQAQRESDVDRKLEIADLNKQESSLQKQLRAAQSLAVDLTNEDLSGKSEQKMQEKLGARAGEAGVSMQELRDIAEASKDKGILGTGILRGEDKTKKSELLQQKVVDPIKNMLDAIAARKKELISGGAQVAQPRKEDKQKEETASAPKPGDIVDGYEFLGKDPADPKNWKPAVTTTTAKK